MTVMNVSGASVPVATALWLRGGPRVGSDHGVAAVRIRI